MTRPEELEKRLNLLVKFGGLISAETNLTRLLEVIAEQVQEMLNGDRCSVFILDRNTNELWSKVAQGMQQTEIRVPFGKGIAGNVASSGQFINIKDAYQDPRFNRDLDMMTGYQTTSILAVPLKNVAGRMRSSMRPGSFFRKKGIMRRRSRRSRIKRSSPRARSTITSPTRMSCFSASSRRSSTSSIRSPNRPSRPKA